jgi:hypothetical protein
MSMTASTRTLLRACQFTTLAVVLSAITACGGDKPATAESADANRSSTVAATTLSKASSAARLLSSPDVSPFKKTQKTCRW